MDLYWYAVAKCETLGVINSTVGVMPDENLRNALSALFPDIFKGEKISSSAKYVTFTDGTLNISDKNITSLEGLEYFSNIRKLICNNNDISEIPAEVLSRLSELTAQNTGLTKLELATSEQPNTTLVSLNIDGSTKLESVDLYYCYNIEKFSALNCKTGISGCTQLPQYLWRMSELQQHRLQIYFQR